MIADRPPLDLVICGKAAAIRLCKSNGMLSLKIGLKCEDDDESIFIAAYLCSMWFTSQDFVEEGSYQVIGIILIIRLICVEQSTYMTCPAMYKSWLRFLFNLSDTPPLDWSYVEK